MKNSKLIAFNILSYFAGCGIYSVGLLVFCEPNGLSPGGVTGIAIILSNLLGLNKGLLIAFLNIPLLYLGLRILGKNFIINTAVATAVFSFSVEVAGMFVKPLVTDKIGASLFGGTLMGLGLGIVMLRGATTGGTDIAARLINRKYPSLSIGRAVLIIDAAVVLLSAIINGNAEILLYSAVMLYTSSRVIDAVIYGANGGKLLEIMTEKPQEMVTVITKRLGRGATVLTGKGGYTGKEVAVVFTALRRHELYKAIKLIKETDKNAFAVITDSSEVLGKGFSNTGN